MAPLTLGAAASNYNRHATSTMNWYLANTLCKLLVTMRYHHPTTLNLSFSSFPDWRSKGRLLTGPGVVGDSMQLRVRIRGFKRFFLFVYLNVSWVLNLSGFTFSIRNKRKHIQHVSANVFSTRLAHTPAFTFSSQCCRTCLILMVSHEMPPSVYESQLRIKFNLWKFSFRF